MQLKIIGKLQIIKCENWDLFLPHLREFDVDRFTKCINNIQRWFSTYQYSVQEEDSLFRFSAEYNSTRVYRVHVSSDDAHDWSKYVPKAIKDLFPDSIGEKENLVFPQLLPKNILSIYLSNKTLEIPDLHVGLSVDR